MADYELSARLNDQQILAALKNIDANIDKLTKNGEDAFRKVGQGSKSSAAGMGVLAGATTAVVTKLLEMGQAAARAFAEILKGAIDSAKALETSTTSVRGILGGDASAALAAMDRIRQESIRLGVDLTELAPAFLPRVENLDQFAKVGELIGSLATLDPAQGAAGARIALTEALVGDLVSLRKRFELDVTPIQKAQAEFGELEGLLIGLEEILKSRGQDFETLSQTATVAMNQTRQIGEDVKTTFGEPILDALKEDFQELNEFLLDNKDDLDLIVGSLGDLVGEVADFSGDQIIEFIENLDPEKILDFVTNMRDAVSLVEIIIETAKNGNEFIVGFGDGISGIGDSVKPFRDFLVELITLMGKLNGEFNAFMISSTGAGLVARGFVTGGVEGAAQARTEVLTAAEEARTKGIEDAAEIVDQLTAAFEENDEAAQNRANGINDNNDADLAAANAALANKQALDAEAKAAEEAASAQEKYNDAREEFEIDKERAAQDLALKQQRALLDAEIEFAQKREDLARKNAQKIEDIYRKNVQRIADAATDLRRDEEDIARKGARQQIEIEREQANRRIEIETDFRRELERIRERFDFDAQEAIRQNDAIAFLRIQRQKDFELQQARTQRDEEVQDAETAAVEQRQKLQEQLQLQIEDARLANQRKLEDLRLSLQRELQEQQIRYAREVQEAKIAEQRKRDELARTFQRQQEDFQRFWDRKLQDLIRNYQKELQIIQQFEAQKARLMAESRARARATAEAASADRVLLQNYGNRRNPVIDTPTNRAQAAGADKVLTQNYTGRRFGKYTPAGIPFLVGESGPELVRFKSPVDILPNYRLRFNPTTARIVNNYNNNTRQTSLNVDALMSMLSPQQIAIVHQIVNQLGMSIYQ